MDPQDLAIKFHAILQISKMLGDEYREMYPTDYKRHTPTKIALKDGFRGY